MKKLAVYSIVAASLVGCGTTALMERSEDIKSQPQLLINTDGDFWGFGKEGSFDLAGEYKGKYSRSASGSTWFNTISTNEGDMVAEITRVNTGKTWQLICSGGGTSVNLGMLSFGGGDPYRCDIQVDGQSVGEYEIAPKEMAISIDLAKYETGIVRINDRHFNVKSVHKAEGMFMTVEKPLGYIFEQGTETVAAVQTNGMLSLQMLPELADSNKDLVVVGSIASALSWRPED